MYDTMICTTQHIAKAVENLETFLSPSFDQVNIFIIKYALANRTKFTIISSEKTWRSWDKFTSEEMMQTNISKQNMPNIIYSLWEQRIDTFDAPDMDLFKIHKMPIRAPNIKLGIGKIEYLILKTIEKRIKKNIVYFNPFFIYLERISVII